MAVVCRKQRLTEEEFLDAIASIYREGGYAVLTPQGATCVALSRERFERKLEESPYLEAGSVAHITPVAA
jgi:hypothetical protein